MHDDVEVQDRLRSAWDDLPTHEPDLGAIRRKGSRRRAGRVFGVAIATAFVVGALVLPLWTLAGIGDSSDSPAAGPSTRQQPPPDSRAWITIDAQEALREPETLIGELASEGIDASIVQVPIDPTEGGDGQVGRWNQVTFGRANAISAADFDALADDGNFGRARMELPSPISGPVTLYVNRAVRGGEVPWFFGTGHQTNELGPTGTFWCLGLEAMSPSEATSTLQSLGYRVSWLHVDADLGMFPVDALPTDQELVFSFLAGPGQADLRYADHEEAERARQAFGTPSDRYPRDTWSDWAACG